MLPPESDEVRLHRMLQDGRKERDGVLGYALGITCVVCAAVMMSQLYDILATSLSTIH